MRETEHTAIKVVKQRGAHGGCVLDVTGLHKSGLLLLLLRCSAFHKGGEGS